MDSKNIEFDHTKKYSILGDEVSLILQETDCGLYIVGEIGKSKYYLGPADLGLSSAIKVWEAINNKKLSIGQIKLVIEANEDNNGNKENENKETPQKENQEN